MCGKFPGIMPVRYAKVRQAFHKLSDLWLGTSAVHIGILF